MPRNWKLSILSGSVVRPDTERKVSGASSLYLNSLKIRNSHRPMILEGSQRLPAKSLIGKRVTFSGKVWVQNLKSPARAGLFLRVLEKRAGIGFFLNPKIVFSDEMIDRPIRLEGWNEYHVVIDIPKSASEIEFGFKLLGKGEAWIDDLMVKEVGPEVKPTAVQEQTSLAIRESTNEDLVRQKAYWESGKTPIQPFFTVWLILPVFAITLFIVGLIPQKDSVANFVNQTNEEPKRKTNWRTKIRNFALYFTFAYWMLFLQNAAFCEPFASVWDWLVQYVGVVIDPPIEWMAINWFGIEEELPRPLGSGDTTYNYLGLLFNFLCSIGLALVLTIGFWNKAISSSLVDLLISYLRYFLASAMITYGFLKVSWEMNQFPILGPEDIESLNAKWGDCSPMGIVWRFMGTSETYTFFGGFSEVVAGFLLFFRRTSLVGALFSFGVMTNVVMLNYCYDIPVKTFSSHLLLMAFCLLIHYSPFLKGLLFQKFNHSTDINPPYVGKRTKWVYLGFKFFLLAIFLITPTWFHVSKEVKYLSQQRTVPGWLSDYTVTDFKVDGNSVSLESRFRWKEVSFTRKPTGDEEKHKDSDYVAIIKPVTGQAQKTHFSTVDSGTLKFELSELSSNPQEDWSIKEISEREVLLSGDSFVGTTQVTLKRKYKKKWRVLNRGFRWINEVPYSW